MPAIKDNLEIFFSCLSGYNLYQPTSEKKQEKLYAVHCMNSTAVEIRRDSTLLSMESLGKWKYFVEHPVDVSGILWPIDVVTFEENSDIGLVFRRRAFPKLETFKTLLYNDLELDWRKDGIKKLLRSFLRQCICLHDTGYAYHCFDIEKMYYDPVKMEMLFDFSLSIARSDRVETIQKERVGIEFLPPWCDMKKDNEMGIVEDNYSIAAILFRTMIGRMPYQGRYMDGKGHMMNYLMDNDEDNHIMMFDAYYSNPVFIFDTVNTGNSIGAYTSEEKYIDRWESLPEKIRRMFSEVLTYSKDRPVKTYSASEWLHALESTVLTAKENNNANNQIK